MFIHRKRENKEVSKLYADSYTGIRENPDNNILSPATSRLWELFTGAEIIRSFIHRLFKELISIWIGYIFQSFDEFWVLGIWSEKKLSENFEDIKLGFKKCWLILFNIFWDFMGKKSNRVIQKGLEN